MLALVTFLLALIVARTTQSQPTTVTELNITAYTGLWFQASANLFVTSTIELNAYCVTATYGELSSNNISVHNVARVGSPTGPVTTMDGFAVVSDPLQPGKLALTFPEIGRQGNYWILQTGAIVNGSYPWSIVSDRYSNRLLSASFLRLNVLIFFLPPRPSFLPHLPPTPPPRFPQHRNDSVRPSPRHRHLQLVLLGERDCAADFPGLPPPHTHIPRA